MGCLNCGKPLGKIEGKRDKVFCNSTCRSNYWQKSKRLEKSGLTEEQIVDELRKSIKIKSAKITKVANNKHSEKVVIEVQDNPRPIKRADEDAYDYAFRVSEWKKNNK